MPLQDFSLRKSRLLYLFWIILFTGGLCYFAIGPYNKTKIIFEVNFPVALITIIFLITATAYSWYGFFNRNSVVTFSVSGIIYKKNLIRWQEIESYKTINEASDTIDSFYLVITLQNSDKEYTINLFGLDTDRQHIRHCIHYYSSIPIVDKGHFEK